MRLSLNDSLSSERAVIVIVIVVVVYIFKFIQFGS